MDVVYRNTSRFTYAGGGRPLRPAMGATTAFFGNSNSLRDRALVIFPLKTRGDSFLFQTHCCFDRTELDFLLAESTERAQTFGVRREKYSYEMMGNVGVTPSFFGDS
jgi:hypothetical protein